MLTWGIFFAAAIGPAYLIMRKRAGFGWAFLSYCTGMTAAFALLVGGLLIMETNGVPLSVEQQLFGPAIWAALIGPGIGWWFGRRARRLSP
jgi:hypothetical protein